MAELLKQLAKAGRGEYTKEEKEKQRAERVKKIREEVQKLRNNESKITYREFTTAPEVNQYFYKTKSYQKWKETLTPIEINDIQGYTGSKYRSINRYNRGIWEWASDGKYGKIKDKIDEAFRKAGPRPGRLSGESWDEYKRRLDKEWIHHDYENAKRIRDEVEDANKSLNRIIEDFNLEEDIVVYRGVTRDELPEFNELTDLIGRKHSDKSYMSTAPVLSGGFEERPYILIIKVPKGKGRGAYFEELTLNSGEQEFLMKKNSNFKIQNVRYEAGKSYVEMELIP